MIRGPKVGPEIAAPHGSTCSRLDGNGKFSRAPGFARDNFVETCVGTTLDQGQEFGDGEGDQGADVCHDLKCMPTGGRVKASMPYTQFGHTGHTLDMSDIWPQRQAFRARLGEFLERTRQTQAQFCDLIGVSLDHLRNALYRPAKRLSLDAIQRSAGIFGVSVTEFIDDPGAEILGQDLVYLSDQARFFASLMVKDMASEDLTDEDRKFIYQDFQSAIQRHRAVKARKAEGPGPNSAHKVQEDRIAPGVPPLRVPRKKQ